MKEANNLDLAYNLMPMEDLLKYFASKMGTTWENNRYSIPQQLGNGQAEAFDYGGFSVALSQFHLSTDIRVSRKASQLEDFINFDYILNGIKGIDSWESSPDQQQLLYGVYVSTALTPIEITFKSNRCYRMLSILIKKEWVKAFLGRSLPESLQKTDQPINLYCGLKTTLIPVFSQLINSSPAHAFRKQYLYSKVLEVITLTFESLMEQVTNDKPASYHPDDIRTIMAVADFMEQTPEKSFTIEELSNRFIINRDKLQIIFKSVFGKTIATFARYHRMMKAMELLKAGRSVSEVGYSLGYANLSHFSRAFRKVHGINPSVILRQLSPK